MNQEDEILAALSGNTAWMRVVGRGSHLNSNTMRRFAAHAANKGCRTLVIDMKDCCAIDSTFMGMLAAVIEEFPEEEQNPVRLLNMSPKLLGLTGALGLNQLLEQHETGTPLPAYARPLEQASMQQLETSEADKDMVIDAHQRLSDLSEENRVRFKTVLEFLAQDEEPE